MPKVFIVGGRSPQYENMYYAAGWDVCKGPLKADLIQFTGGEDVSPCLYGEERHRTTGDNLDRDLYEAGFFAFARRMGIPMAGICRGGQFLNVMSGGKMYQHVSKHATGLDHPLTDIQTGRVLSVSSTHHQMMRKGEAGILVASAGLGGFKQHMIGSVVTECHDPDEPDTEVVYYPDTKALCFQPHPEFFDVEHECPQYFFELLERYHGLRA